MPDQQVKYDGFKVAPTLRAFSKSNAFIRGLMGPWRSGKSSACIMDFMKKGQLQNPGPDGIRHSRFTVVRNTYGELKDTVIKTFHTWFPPIHWGTYNATDHDYRIQAIEGTDIEFNFRALDRPDHIQKLLSYETTGAWVNEAREIPWPIIEALQGRVGQFPPMNAGGPTWHGLVLDTNPPDVDSEWFKFFEKQKHDPTFAELFKQPSGLSPEAENLSNLKGGRDYYLNLARGKNEEFIKVYIKGEYGFVIDGKPVYAEYNDRLHCNPDIYAVDDLPVWVGLDFGLTPAAVYSQINELGLWKIFAELVATGMGVDRFSDQMLEFQSQFMPNNHFKYVGDPAGNSRAQTDEKTCFGILHAKGIPVEEGLQNPKLRIESVRKPLRTLILGEPQFQVHPRCEVLRKGFLGGYQFKRLQVSGERYTDKPDKNQYSHPHDGLQYVATRMFGLDLLTSNLEEEDEDEDYSFVNPTRSKVTGY